MEGSDRPPLDRERHLKYWVRCLRTLLPHHYTPNDGNRMALGYFILSAIDLLTPSSPAPDPASAPQDSTRTASSSSPSNPPPHHLTPSDRRLFRRWVLSCQHPGGGFCGSPSIALPAHASEGWDFESRTPEVGHPEQANLPATCFALMLLAMLSGGDDSSNNSVEGEGDGWGPAACAFSGVHRARTLRWLRRLQREDGSFGEVLGRVVRGRGDAKAETETEGHSRGGDGSVDFIAGGKDMRYCYIAALVRWMLRGEVGEGDAGWVEDIDVQGLVRYIGKSQTYDGGIAESSQHEPHAGYAYCAISALAILDRPPRSGHVASGAGASLHTAFEDGPTLARWLVSRQFVYLDSPDADADADNFTEPPSVGGLSLDEGNPENYVRHVAFNGRCNKVADTCYTWWVGAALATLAEGGLVASGPARRFLLDQTQHVIGGFAKHPGGPPDLYHAYFGLAALAVLGEPGLRRVDAALAVSVDTARKIEAARDGLLRRAGGGEKGKGEASNMGTWMLDMGLATSDGGRPAWLSTEGR